MRLTCPNCGADYEVPEGMLPAGGRHVQCSICHTRWFQQGAAAAVVEEDQIIHRLERLQPRPRPVPAPVPQPVVEEEAAAEPEAETAGEARQAAAPIPFPVPDPPRRDLPTKPAERPTVARPAQVPDEPVRTAPRLDLGETARSEAARPAPPRSRFLGGLLLVLVPFLIAFGAYRFNDEIAAEVPAAAPALDTYAAAIDGWRAEIERRIAEFRAPREG
jgi:predicted Zn finger-like uncharacterized protein